MPRQNFIYERFARTERLVCIDLFSGAGGWNQAFDRQLWDVIEIDSDPEMFPTICRDIFDIDPSYLPKNPDVILASPPCQKFSNTSITLNWKKRAMKNPNVVLAVGLVAKTLDIIYKLQPRYWILENPSGMLRNVLGKPVQQTYFRSWERLPGEPTPNLKPTDLWGNIPEMEWPKPEPGWETDGTRKIDNAVLSATIPWGLSNAVAKAIEKDVLGRWGMDDGDD